jgi:hypothetical protein
VSAYRHFVLEDEFKEVEVAEPVGLCLVKANLKRTGEP